MGEQKVEHRATTYDNYIIGEYNQFMLWNTIYYIHKQ